MFLVPASQVKYDDPGEVVAYERNVATNEILDRAGVTVHTIPSYELPRGRGGPRCWRPSPAPRCIGR